MVAALRIRRRDDATLPRGSEAHLVEDRADEDELTHESEPGREQKEQKELPTVRVETVRKLRVQRKEQRKEFNEGAGQHRPRPYLPQRERAIRHESVDGDHQAHQCKCPGDHADDAEPRRRCKSTVGAHHEQHGRDEDQHHDQPHGTLTKYVALRGSEDRCQREFHRCEEARATPQQSDNRHDAQDARVVLDAVECLDDLRMSILWEDRDNGRVDGLLSCRVIDDESHDGEHPENEGKHREERVIGQARGVVAALALAVGHHDLDRAPLGDALQHASINPVRRSQLDPPVPLGHYLIVRLSA